GMGSRSTGSGSGADPPGSSLGMATSADGSSLTTGRALYRTSRDRARASGLLAGLDEPARLRALGGGLVKAVARTDSEEHADHAEGDAGRHDQERGCELRDLHFLHLPHA